MIAITLGNEKFRAELQDKLGRAKNPRGVLLAVGREAQQQLKRHFRMKNRTEPNSLSPRRTNFWRQIDLSTQAPVVDVGGVSVKIAITDPRMAQKVFGGPIRPKRAGALTIPRSEEAYGRTAETFEAETGLKLFLIQSGDFAALATRRSKDSKFLQIEFVLSKGVNQKKDPTALPDMKEGSPFLQALLARGDAALQRQLNSGGNN